MKLGFDAKRANSNRTGLGNYSRYIISSLLRFHPNYYSTLYLPFRVDNREYDALFEQSSGLCETQPSNFFSRLFHPFWRLFSIASSAQRDGVQLFHGLSNELPFFLRHRGLLGVVTIHDLIFLRLGSHYPFFDRMIYNWKFRRACKAADMIIAISECTKRDIIHFYGIDPSKIVVIYQGCDPRFSLSYSEELKDRIRRKYHLPKKFMLTVGTLEERKNLLVCVQALEHLPSDIHLVAVGRATAYSTKVMKYAASRGLLDRIQLIHDCPFFDLPILYRLASVFCYMSRYEGFGIPIVEALSSGIPTIAGRGSCLEEAGGDAAIYTDCDDAQALADAVLRFNDDALFRGQQVAKGLAYVERFSAENIAGELDLLYRNLLSRSCQ